jgi:hypothetical protein
VTPKPGWFGLFGDAAPILGPHSSIGAIFGAENAGGWRISGVITDAAFVSSERST